MQLQRPGHLRALATLRGKSVEMPGHGDLPNVTLSFLCGNESDQQGLQRRHFSRTEMSRNPYRDSGRRPLLRNSVFAYIDILGYADLIVSAERDGTQEELLGTLHRTLLTNRRWLGSYPSMTGLKNVLKKDLYVLKAFTDNIVLAWPIREDAEVELGSAFSKLSDFQFTMSLQGFFVRGGISIGMAYVDDVVVFGDALTQAYAAESIFARDPRVVLTESSVQAVRKHLEYYSSPRHAPQTSHVLCDSDGQWFVNYLNCVLYAVEEQGPFYDEFLKHKAAVEVKLSQHRNNPSIFSKYAWVAGYHNFFCDLYPRYFSDEYKIETELFRTTPKLIVEVES
jgi:hypothetical protein